MPKFKITYGFESEVIQAKNRNAALFAAWDEACEIYEGRSVTQIMDEDCVGVEEAYEIYQEERESCIDYDAIEITD